METGGSLMYNGMLQDMLTPYWKGYQLGLTGEDYVNPYDTPEQQQDYLSFYEGYYAGLSRWGVDNHL